MSATIDRDELDAWMRERDLMLISNEYFADLTRQLAAARHSTTVARTEANRLRAELARDALFQAFERMRALGEEIQRQADHNTEAVAPAYLRGVEQARIAARIRRALELDVPPG